MTVKPEVLLEAADLIRRRVGHATTGPWTPYVLGSEGYDVRTADDLKPVGRGGLRRRLRIARCGYEGWEADKANAEHIASWHPLVALAVADLLEITARDVGTSTLAYHRTADLALAYLGRDR